MRRCWRWPTASHSPPANRPLVNLHTAGGTGNAMGSLVAAYRANTPLIVTAGQQIREMTLCDPYLNNPDATVMPQPRVKWAYEPKQEAE